MLVTTKFAEDARVLATVLQQSETKSAVLSALGVSELGLMSPFQVRISGGTAEFDNLWCNKWASADNEVLVWDQLQALLKVAGNGLEFPNLGPKALVSYDGTNIRAPVNPNSSAIFRLEVDESQPTKLAWKLRPSAANNGLPGSVTAPLTIAIGDFESLPPDTDLEFLTVKDFFDWMALRTIYEPLTLIFNSDEVHDIRYQPTQLIPPVVDDSRGTRSHELSRPYNWRQNMRGRGQLLIQTANHQGVSLPTLVLQLKSLHLKYVKVTVNCLVTIVRDMTTPFKHKALFLERCDVMLNRGVIIKQDVTPNQGNRLPDYVYYSTVLRRCTLQSSTTGYLALTNGTGRPFNWGSIESCNVRNFWLTAFSEWDDTTAVDNLSRYRRSYNRLGWRIANTKWRSSHGLIKYDVMNAPGSSDRLYPCATYTFLNCKAWFGDVILGSALNTTPIIFNAVNSHIRCSGLIVNDSQNAPPILKVLGGSLIAKGMSLLYRLDQNYSGGLNEVQRSQLQIPGYVHVQNGKFGVAQSEATSIPTTNLRINGHGAVKPTIYASGGSDIFVPTNHTVSGAGVVVAGPAGEGGANLIPVI